MVTLPNSPRCSASTAAAGGVPREDVYLLKTSFSFDIFGTEVYGWLVGAGRLAILPTGLEGDPGALLGAIRDAGVTHVNFAPTMLRLLRPGGRYATAGAIAGPLVELDLRTLYLKDLSLFGATVLGAGVFAELVGHIETGRIRPLVAATYPLCEIAVAQAEFLAKRHVGKLVLIP